MCESKKYARELEELSIHVNDAFLDKILANSESTKDAYGHIMDIEGNFSAAECIYDKCLEKIDLADLESMERRYGRTD